MQTFIKENKALVAALLLPVLFAGFFLISKQIATSTINPPAHDFMIFKHNNSYNNSAGVNIKILDGKLSAKFRYPKANNDDRYGELRETELYFVTAKTMIAEKINFSIPDDAMNPAQGREGTLVALEVPEKLRALSFSSSAISPDGFELDYRDSNGGNLMTEIFDTRYNHPNGLVLRQSGQRFPIRGINDNYGFVILGWVTTPSANKETP
jgi:hypothetical protein